VKQPIALKRQLELAKRSGHPVRVKRAELEAGWFNGFVVALGPDFFALQVVDEGVRLGGYSCMRFIDVTECKSPAPGASFIEKALKARKLTRGVDPNLDLSSLTSLLLGANADFPLVSLHIGNVCYVGKVVDISKGDVHLLEVTPDAKWESKPSRYSITAIDRVDFGGPYEEALHLVAGSKKTATPHQGRRSPR